MAQPRSVLIAGGGPAAIEAALALQRLAQERVTITLVSDSESLIYRPSATLTPFGRPRPQRFSLPGLAADRGWRFVRAAVHAVDPMARRVCVAGDALAYDALLLALGAAHEPAVPGALTFTGEHDALAVRTALEDTAAAAPPRAAFVAPRENAWTLPVYELALLTAHWARERGLAIEPWVVTHEDRALGVLGAEPSRAVMERLDDAGVRLWTDAVAEVVEDGALWMNMEGGMPVAVAVALARPVGRPVTGIPHDERGFVAADAFGRVPRVPDVYAVGDMTTRPLRQGGLATQQADAAASAIAAWSGAPLTPQPYRPVLRAMLLTGGTPLFLQRGAVSAEAAPWWPPHKVAGRELAPYLEAHRELLLSPAPV